MDRSTKWKHHPVADIAMIELDLKSKTIPEDYAFPVELIHSGKELPRHESDLIFLGFQIVDMEMEHFSPLIFTGYLYCGCVFYFDSKSTRKSN